MIRRPPRSTLTDTSFPEPSICRSGLRHVSRPHQRDGADARCSRRPGAPLHAAAARFLAGARPVQAPRLRPQRRRGALARRSASRLRLPYPLPPPHADLQRAAPGTATLPARTQRGLPPLHLTMLAIPMQVTRQLADNISERAAAAPTAEAREAALRR